MALPPARRCTQSPAPGKAAPASAHCRRSARSSASLERARLGAQPGFLVEELEIALADRELAVLARLRRQAHGIGQLDDDLLVWTEIAKGAIEQEVGAQVLDAVHAERQVDQRLAFGERALRPQAL